MRYFERFLICCVGWLLLALGSARAANGPHAGPLFDKFPLTLTAGHRTEALGPLFYSEQEGTRKTWTLPPIFSHTTDPSLELTQYDVGYPVITYRQFGPEYRWQFIQLFSFAGSRDVEQTNSRRFTIFPFYFQQRSQDPSKNYTAVAPFYGHLHNRLLRDDIFFVMFPLYSRTRKGDVVTWNYLYPFFDVRRGNGLHGWQFWPVVGHEHKVLTTRTNGFGDVSLVGGHDSWFVLWPFFLEKTSGIGTTNVVRQQALLPLYSFTRSPQRDSTTVLWPFVTHTTDRQKQFREWDTPWPLIVFARGKGKTTSRVWPFFSQAHNANLESDWYLWPVYKYNRVHVGALNRERTRILLFLYSDIFQQNTNTHRFQRRIDFWPLFSRRRDRNGNTRLQLFAPLEPILPFSKAVERDYSPLWSVWRAERNARTGATSQSFLWNLYRRSTTPRSKKISLLFGLFQYQSSPAGKRLRLFYVPVVNTLPAANGGRAGGN